MEIVTKKLRCIVIDDDNDIADVFSEMLGLCGLQVVGIGHTGIDAVSLFEQMSPDVVFMDVHMPKLNGAEALKQIKEKSINANVVMVTSDMSKDLEVTLQNAGANAIVYKPFDMKKITSVLEEIQTSSGMVIQR